MAEIRVGIGRVGAVATVAVALTASTVTTAHLSVAQTTPVPVPTFDSSGGVDPAGLTAQPAPADSTAPPAPAVPVVHEAPVDGQAISALAITPALNGVDRAVEARAAAARAAAARSNTAPSRQRAEQEPDRRWQNVRPDWIRERQGWRVDFRGRFPFGGRFR